MIRTLDALLCLFASAVSGAVLLSIVTFIVVAVGNRSYPRAPRDWAARLQLCLCVTWVIGPVFVFLTGYLLFHPVWYGAPMGDVVLKPKEAQVDAGVEVTYGWNDALYMTGMHMEWWATFYAVCAGERIERRFGPANLDTWETALDQRQITEALQSLDIDIDHPAVERQIDQLTDFFDRLGAFGLVVDGLTAFDCQGPGDNSTVDERIPTNVAMAWLGIWTGMYAFSLLWAWRPEQDQQTTQD